MELLDLLDATDMQDLKEKMTNPEKTKYQWVIPTEFPHCIQMVRHATNTDNQKVFDDIDDAFKHRRNISKYYYNAYKLRTEYARAQALYLEKMKVQSAEKAAKLKTVTTKSELRKMKESTEFQTEFQTV